MPPAERVIRNAEVLGLELAVPPGHRHLRATLHLSGGERLILQEATVAALVRAYTNVKTHPGKTAVRLVGRELPSGDRKPDFAAWQLLEGD